VSAAGDAFWAYRAFWRMELARIRREEDVLTSMLISLNAVRLALLDRAAFASRTWDIRTTRMMLVEVERLLGFWADAQTVSLVSEMERAWDSGAAQTTSVFKAAGLSVSVAPYISRTMLQLATSTAPTLISGISRDLTTALSRELRRSVLAQEGPVEFMQRIGGPIPLEPAAGRPAIQTGPFAGNYADPGLMGTPAAPSLPAVGHFPTAFHRAEAVYRTEIGRLASMAQQATLAQTAMMVPGMQKRWSALLDRRSRPEHAAAHMQTVEWNGQYEVGGERLSYPRDPRASAKNSVNCRCTSLPWNDEWAKFGAKQHIEQPFQPWVSDEEYRQQVG
jgi:hypothetical protein